MRPLPFADADDDGGEGNWSRVAGKLLGRLVGTTVPQLVATLGRSDASTSEMDVATSLVANLVSEQETSPLIPCLTAPCLHQMREEAAVDEVLACGGLSTIVAALRRSGASQRSRAALSAVIGRVADASVDNVGALLEGGAVEALHSQLTDASDNVKACIASCNPRHSASSNHHTHAFSLLPPPVDCHGCASLPSRCSHPSRRRRTRRCWVCCRLFPVST